MIINNNNNNNNNNSMSNDFEANVFLYRRQNVPRTVVSRLQGLPLKTAQD